MSSSPTRKVRITTADNAVHWYENEEEAIQEYGRFSATGQKPRMTLFDPSGQEIPAMKAHPDWIID